MTPAHVVTAIQTVAEYLRATSYGSVIIAPGGGASFHLRNVLDEKADLFREIARLEDEVQRVSLPTGSKQIQAGVEETQVNASDYRTLHRKWMETRAELTQLQEQNAALTAALALRISEREALRSIVVAALVGRFDRGEAERVLREM